MAKSFYEISTQNVETTPLLTSYDPNKLNLGRYMIKKSGIDPQQNVFGPMDISIARPMEANVAIPGVFPHVINVSNTLQWVFLADNASAAATRRVILYEYDLSSYSYLWKGFVTLTFPTATTHTIRGFRVSRELYTTGTASVSDTTVTGSGTAWSSSGIPSGVRIGFGSTDPNEITSWHEVSTVNSNTSITLTSSAGSVSSGPYVIEDLRLVVITTNATAANGGLFLVKGLRIENFTPAGTTIAAATTSDGQRAVYWLADDNTVTNTAAAGSAIEDMSSWTEHNLYVINTGTRIYKYNIRATLTGLSAGKTISAYILQTNNVTVTGTISQVNNGRIASPQHGPAPSVPSLYFVTTTRVYRTSLASITSGGTDWLTNVMVEVPPGGTSTYSLSGAFSAIEYDSSIDKFIITSSGAAGVRSYITEFKTDGSQFDHIFLVDDKQLDQSLADSQSPVHPAINVSAFTCWSELGVLHMARAGTAATVNQVYAIPISAHWRYSGDQQTYVISPAMDTTGATKLYRLLVNSTQYDGSDTFSLPTEPFQCYFRTSGINDNTGSWVSVPRDGNLRGIAPSNQIQFRFDFKIIGSFCIPARIMSFALLYEDSSSDSHYAASVAKSNVSSNVFSWIQSEVWGEDIPNLRIKITNSVTKSLVLEDTVFDSTYGTWEYSTNGTTWNSWSSSADAVGNYIRYTANSLPNSIKVSAVLSIS